MPSGLPPSLSALPAYVTERWHAVSTYLQIPTYDEYAATLRTALRDLAASSRSTYELLHLTLRPVLILLALLSRYLAIGLKIIGEHTVKHGIVAAREGLIQAKTASIWFVRWQRGLSNWALGVECAIICGLVGLYVLRRYIRRRRYVQRVRGWYRRKRNMVQRRYDAIVNKVSETSLFLALLLPHLLYVLSVSGLRYIAPWLVRYLATRTYLTTLVSLWIPLVRTVTFLNRLRISREERTKALEKDIGAAATAVAVADDNKTRKSPRTRSKTGRAADRYVRATMKASNGAGMTGGSSSDKEKDSPTSSSKEADSMAALYEEAADLLQYWVLYALLGALFRTLQLLPIFNKFVTPATATSSASKQTSRWAPQPTRASKWITTQMARVRPSAELLEEIRLLFYVWLRYLPTSLFGSTGSRVGTEEEGTVQTKSVKSKTAAYEDKLRKKKTNLATSRRRTTMAPHGKSNRPIDIMYRHMAPVAASVADFSLSLTQSQQQKPKKDAATSALGAVVTKSLSFLRSFLDVAVFTKLISASTRDWIVTSLAEGAALLPAAITLLMPGYFTEFGVVYVSSVVPAANSAATRSSLVEQRSLPSTEEEERGASSAASAAVRYLQFWVVHAMLSSLLRSFRPVLAWVPLSTHATWLLWAYVQLGPVSRMLYGVLEWELTAFGLLTMRGAQRDGCSGGGEQEGSDRPDVEGTVTVRLLRRLSSALPSGVSVSASPEEGKKDGDTVGRGDGNANCIGTGNGEGINLTTSSPSPSFEDAPSEKVPSK